MTRWLAFGCDEQTTTSLCCGSLRRVRNAAIIGLLFNVAGTSLAGWALWQDYSQHADRPLLPWAASARAWFRLNVLRRKPRTISVTTSGTASWNVATSASGSVSLAADAPIDRQIAYLREQVESLHDRIGEQRREFSDDISRVNQALSQARTEAHEAVTRVEKMAKGIATGTVKIQIIGLMLVGFGSVIAALPVVLGWK